MKKIFVVAFIVLCLGLFALDNSDLSREPLYWRNESWYIKSMEVNHAREMLGGLVYGLVDYTAKYTGWYIDNVWFGAWFNDYRTYVTASAKEKAETLSRLQGIVDGATEAMLDFVSSGAVSKRNYYAVDLIQAVANLQLCAEALMDGYKVYVVDNGYRGTDYYVASVNAPSKTITMSVGNAPVYLFQSVWYILEGTPTSVKLRAHPAMKKVYAAFDELCDALKDFGFMYYRDSRKGNSWGRNVSAELNRYTEADFPLK